jgi:lipoprotein-anchoring transpeptidase ErfK/SrfK
MCAAHHWRRAALALAATLFCSATTLAQPLAMTEPGVFPASIFEPVLARPAVPQVSRQAAEPADESAATVPAHLRRQVVAYDTREAPGTIVIDTPNTYLYYVLGGGRAIRYGIGVGRDGFNWSGVHAVNRKQEWPDWHPPAEMIARQPYLPRFMSGGPGNPLGARAMYLGGTLYRIHGTNQPHSIGQRVSSGCFRLLNEDVIDLYNRVNVGAKVVVLPDMRRHAPADVARAPRTAPVRERVSQAPRPAHEAPQPAYEAPRPVATVPGWAASLHYGAAASRLY